MKHRLGNSPRCFECKYYEEAEDVRTKKVVGYCTNKAHLRLGVNGKILEKPKERVVTERWNCCRFWVDAESGHTRFEVLTGYKEPYDGTKIDRNNVYEQQRLELE